MKLMALDFGTKRVGIASTDESGEFALPRVVLPNDETLLDKTLEFIAKEGVEKVVMGDSRNFQGAPNQIMQEVEEFKKKLEDRGVKVILHPEIMTTVEARHLQGQSDLTDASAAALILKSFIDSGYNK